MTEFRDLIPRLPVRDLQRTVRFYCDVLGFRVEVSWPDAEPTFVILSRNQATVGFFAPSEHQPGPPGYAELYVRVTDAVALHEQLASLVAIEWGPEVYAYGRREFAIRDPDAYLLIFTEPTDDPQTTSEPD
jgi:catechol 2,3-dioxygenase-like lactoylglutathione lyase family enzyme